MEAVLSANSYNSDNLRSSGYIVIENNTGTELLTHYADEKYYPASTTKLLTALTALDYLSAYDKIKVGNEIYLAPDNSSSAGIKKGDIFTFDELLYALLLPSGSDASLTIATSCGRKIAKNDNLSEAESITLFVNAMNNKAQKIGMNSSNFVSPHGYYDEKHYSTPRDMLLLAQKCIKNKLLLKICGTAKYKVVHTKATYEWYNTNLLLQKSLDGLPWGYSEKKGVNSNYNKNIKGIKTGSNEKAKKCLIFLYEENGVQFLGAVFKCEEEQIWSEVNKMTAYLMENYNFKTLHKNGLFKLKYKIKKTSIFSMKKGHVAEKGSIQAYLPMEMSGDFDYKFLPNPQLTAVKGNRFYLKQDIKKGQKLGSIIFTNNDKVVYQKDITAVEDIHKAYWFDYVISFVVKTLILVGVVIVAIIFYFHRHGKKVIVLKK